MRTPLVPKVSHGRIKSSRLKPSSTYFSKRAQAAAPCWKPTADGKDLPGHRDCPPSGETDRRGRQQGGLAGTVHGTGPRLLPRCYCRHRPPRSLRPTTISSSLWRSRSAGTRRTCSRLWPLIVDECHHWVAETLSKTLSKFPARCVLGLTATPERRDGCGFALPYFFGPTTVRMKRIGQSVQVKVIKIPCGKAKEIFGRNGKPILPRTITMMTEDEQRNERIVSTVLALRNEGRYVIVLGERRKHLGVLRRFSKSSPVGLYVGETSKKRIAVREAEKTPHPVGHCPHVEEGLDIARLDTLVLITPKAILHKPSVVSKELTQTKNYLLSSWIFTTRTRVVLSTAWPVRASGTTRRTSLPWSKFCREQTVSFLSPTYRVRDLRYLYLFLV